MDLAQNELETLRFAVTQPEGRIVTFDLNDRPLSVTGVPGIGLLELGEEGLQNLLEKRLLLPAGGASYIITKTGRAYVDAHPIKGL